MKHLIRRHRHPLWPLAPWDTMEKMMKRFYEDPWFDITKSEIGDWAPAIDIEDKDDKYIVTAEVPGVNPKDVEIVLQEGVLSIKGEKKTEKKEEEKGYVRTERSFGSFYREFRLPDADEEKIKANAKDGILTITIPKTTKRAAKRKIEIESTNIR